MDAAAAVAALGALAQDTRLQVFRLLVERGPDGLPAGVISEHVGVPPSSLTFTYSSFCTPAWSASAG